MEPINYAGTFAQQPSVGDQFLQGLQVSQAMQAQAEAKRQAEEQAKAKAEQEAAMQADIMDVYNRGAPASEVARLTVKYPALAKQYKDTHEMLSKDEQIARKAFGAQVDSALQSGKVDIAKQLIDQRIQAAENSGNTQEAQAWKATRQVVETDPNAAKLMSSSYMAAIDDKYASSLATVGKESREQALFPAAKQEAEAKAKQADAEVIIKQAEAKFAPQRFGAELGLTQAQIEAVKAQRRASDASAANSMAQALRAQSEANQMGAGVIPADKRPEAESKFRKEYSDQTKGYQEVKSAYSRVLSSDDNAVGDLSLIFGYMKMLDPGSVVREGEFATAQNAAGVPERVLNAYNRALNGERLTPAQRSAFKSQAGKLYSSAQQQEAQVRTGLERIAKGYGLNTSNIFYTPNEIAPMPASDVNAKAVPGQRNVIVNY